MCDCELLYTRTVLNMKGACLTRMSNRLLLYIYLLQWNPLFRTPGNQDTSITGHFLSQTPCLCTLQPLKSGHLTNKDTFFHHKCVWIKVPSYIHHIDNHIFHDMSVCVCVWPYVLSFPAGHVYSNGHSGLPSEREWGRRWEWPALDRLIADYVVDLLVVCV